MVQSIRLDGLASGLDTTSLVNKLMSLERMPLVNMQSQQQKLQWKVNALKSIKSNVFALQTKATDLTRSATFSAMKATSSDEKVATATAQNGSASAAYVVNVTSLATADRYTSNALGLNAAQAARMVSTADISTASTANPNAAFNSGLTNLDSAVTAGSFYVNNVRVDVTATDTINTVLNKITSSLANVTATYDSATEKITLTQKTGGAAPTITLSGDTSGFLAAAKLSGAAVTAGVDADENRLLQDVTAFAGLNNGYFSINGAFFAVDKSKDTLAGLINKINSSSIAGVTAFYDANSKQITINSTKAGVAGNITLGTGATDTSNFLSSINITNIHSAGTNAVVTINGTAVQPVDNKVTLNGATFTIKSAGQATITVGSDIDKMVDSVKAFVDQYNQTFALIRDEAKEKPLSDPKNDTDKQVGILYGDATLRSLSNSLRDLISTTVSGMPASMSQLSQIGITTGAIGSSVSNAQAGTLVLDETKLRNALTNNAQAVASLLGNGTAAVSNEAVGTGNGSLKVFTLDNKPVAFAPTPSITVNGITYTMVAGTPSTNPLAHEYSLNYTTGDITFGVAPGAGEAIVANYNYSVSTGSRAGIAVQFASLIGSYTRVGGNFDTSIGSSGSITKQISDITKQMESMQRRLDQREAYYYRRFTAMETALSTLQSQGNWLTSQLANLPGFGTSSK